MGKHIFRAMLKSGGWLYWNEYGELTTENGKRHAFEIKNKNGKHLYYYVHELRQQIKAETVGMWSGLSDKNGKKIFEGDVLSAHFDSLFPNEESIYVAVWHENGWCIKYIAESFDTYDPADDEEYIKQYFTVIGNIHDNPEPLEVSE